MIQIRASSLSELFDCPARWKAKYIYGLTLPRTPAAILGTAVHAGTAAFDKSILEKNPITPDDATEEVVNTLHHPEEDVDWGEDSPQRLEPIAIKLHTDYCENIAPKQRYVAVEAKCKELQLTDLNISLSGTTDRICKNKGYGIVDLKTGKNVIDSNGVVKTQGHIAQIGVYELLAEYSFGEKITEPASIIAMKTAKNTHGPSIKIGYISDAKKLLIGDETTKGLLEYAAHYINTDTFHGNPRSMLCHKKYCPIYDTCKWRL